MGYGVSTMIMRVPEKIVPTLEDGIPGTFNPMVNLDKIIKINLSEQLATKFSPVPYGSRIMADGDHGYAWSM